MELGRDWDAVQAAQRAAAERPQWPTAFLTLSRAQLNLGEPQLALQSIEHALALQVGCREVVAWCSAEGCSKDPSGVMAQSLVVLCNVLCRH